MGKFIGFVLLWQLVGNPLAAIVILFVILYILDRRFVGLFPSVTQPFRRMRRISRLRTDLSLNPNDISAKFELARLLAERKRYAEAKELLTDIGSRYEQSAEYWVTLGECCLKLGQLQEGEGHMLTGLALNNRVLYGSPYLRLAEAYRKADSAKALDYIGKFQDIQSSSSESYYRLGSIYRLLDRREEAKRAFGESLAVYKSLPKYLKRKERKWAVRSFFARLR